MPGGWFVGRPAYRHDLDSWEHYAFDATEKAVNGGRSREWTAVGPTVVEVVREMARCLRELAAGRWPRWGLRRVAVAPILHGRTCPASGPRAYCALSRGRRGSRSSLEASPSAGRATSMHRRSKIIVGLSSLLLVGTVAGAAYAVVSPSVSSSTSDVIRTRGSNISLSNSGGEANKTTVLSVNLPEGKWVLSADISIYSSSYSDLFRCAIYKGSTKLDELGIGTFGGPFAASALSISTAVTSSQVFTASLKCWHDGDQGGAQADVEHGSTLWAHKATALDAKTTP